MSVDLTITGDVTAIRDVARWLDGISQAIGDADADLVDVVTDSPDFWEGASGDAFRAAMQSVREHTAIVVDFARDSASVFRAYAHRLERGRDLFAGFADQCTEGGVTVLYDVVVMMPTTTLSYAGPDAPDEDRLAWVAFADRARLYEECARRVGEWWGDLDEWIGENMFPLTERIGDLQTLASAFAVFEMDRAVVERGATIEFLHYALEDDLLAFQGPAVGFQASAQAARGALVSGDSVVQTAIRAADVRGVGDGIEAVSESVESWSHTAGRILPVVGVGIDAVVTVEEVMAGESPTSAAVGFVAGTGVGYVAGAGGAALLALTPAPPLLAVGGVALGVALVTAFAGEGAKWAYEAWVPLDVREDLDYAATGPPPGLDVTSGAVSP